MKMTLDKSIDNDFDAKKLLNFSVKFSSAMLSNGAEVYRVEDSINRICKSFKNIKAVNVFAIDNMVIITFVLNGTNYTSMRRVISSDANLEKLNLLNELSRSIVSGNCDIDEAFRELKRIKKIQSYSNLTKIILLGITAPFLCVIFGGTLRDFIAASMALMFELVFMIYIEKLEIPSLLTITLSASAVTLFAILLSKIIYVHNISSIIISGILILFPGIRITNAMRDILSGDILSSMIGIMKAIFTSISIAVGVVIVLKLLG